MDEASENSEYFEEVFKIITIGDSNVGKTSVLKRYFEDCFTEDTVPTLAWGQKSKKVPIGPKDEYGNQKQVKIEVWDTAG